MVRPLLVCCVVALAGCNGATEPESANVPTIIPLFAVTQDVDANELGTLGGTGGVHVAQGVNEVGHIVGSSTDAAGNLRAFFWTAGGGMVDLGTLGGDSSWGNDINDQDMIVGRSNTASGDMEAFTWTPTGGMQGLGTFGGLSSEAFGLNNQGQVVGRYGPPSRGTHSFLWSAVGGFQEIPTLGSTVFGTAIDINDAGLVVGHSMATDDFADPLLSYHWTAGGGTQSLGTLAADCSEHVAFRVNEFGQVPGGAFNETTGLWHPFVWHADSGFTDLKTQGFAADRSGLAYGINLLGHVAVLILNADSTRTPAAWVPGTGTVELPTLGGQDGEIWGINDLGMVVGWSETAGGNARPVKWQLVFAPEERIGDAIAALQTIADTTSDQGARDKVEAVIEKAEKAVEKFSEDPPDNPGGLGELEGAVGELEAAIDGGHIGAELGTNLLEVLTQAGQDLAVASIEAAQARGGDPDKIAAAQDALAEGDAYRDSDQHKDAVAKYKTAVSEAESA